MKPNPDATPSAPRKPRLALFVASGLGLGYLPKAPGTWGSLGGVALVYFICQLVPNSIFFHSPTLTQRAFRTLDLVAVVLIGVVGLWSAGRSAQYLGLSDPQLVVIDELCGQVMTFLGAAPVGFVLYFLSPEEAAQVRILPVSWKYLLLGFILFRVFDIWKPFPVRQAEKLPGGWGIMADDWVAAIYAALGLWVARYLGL